MEFAPKCVDILLLVVQAGEFHHVMSDCGMGAISPKHKRKGNFDLSRSFLIRRCLPLFEPSDIFPEVSSSELVVEEDFDIRELLELVKKAFVQPTSVG